MDTQKFLTYLSKAHEDVALYKPNPFSIPNTPNRIISLPVTHYML